MEPYQTFQAIPDGAPGALLPFSTTVGVHTTYTLARNRLLGLPPVQGCQRDVNEDSALLLCQPIVDDAAQQRKPEAIRSTWGTPLTLALVPSCFAVLQICECVVLAAVRESW